MHPFHMEISKQAWDIMACVTPADDPQLLVWAAGAARLTWPAYFLKAWSTGGKRSETAQWEMWEQGFPIGPGRYARMTHYFEVSDCPSISFGRVNVRVAWTACAALMRTADPDWQDTIRGFDPDDTRAGYELGWRIWDTLRPATVQLGLFDGWLS